MENIEPHEQNFPNTTPISKNSLSLNLIPEIETKPKEKLKVWHEVKRVQRKM